MTHEQTAAPSESLRFHGVEIFSAGKNPPRNEDRIGYTDTTIVLSDGATDKTGLDFEGRTGGELASEVVVETALHSDNNGEDLVSEITSNLQALYGTINPTALTDSAYRFAATMVVARAVGDELIITQVGDSSFRVNGSEVHTNDKAIDAITATARKNYIEATNDIAGSREFIMPLLKRQHMYQNNPDSPLGYGVIDGTPVPAQFIRVFVFPRGAVHTLELVSDGYYGVFPPESTLEGYEEVHRTIEINDPNKCGQYPSTKISDDRTVVIARLTD